MFNWQFKACCWENKEIKRHISQGPDQTALILTLGLSTTSIQNLRVNMLWSVNGTAKCIPVILFLPVYFFLISSWLGQDFYIITRPKSYFPYLPYLPLWAYFPGRNIPANSTGKYRGWNLPLNLADTTFYWFETGQKLVRSRSNYFTHDGQRALRLSYHSISDVLGQDLFLSAPFGIALLLKMWITFSIYILLYKSNI